MAVVLRVPSTDGVEIAVHDLGGDGPPLLLCHATGFHGRVWSPVAAELADAWRCWALDFRGHGDSGRPSDGSFSWLGFGDDVLAVVDELGLTGIPAVGHSKGGAALMLAESARPGTFTRLWCYEPIAPPPMEAPPVGENPLAAGAARRRAVFDSYESAIDNFASKPPLSSLRPDALEAYVRHGFAEQPDGSVRLKCAPEDEAAVYSMAARSGVFERLGAVRCPVVVAASGDGGMPSAIAPLVADALPDGRLEHFGSLSHFGPMEDPPAIAQSIRRFLRSL
jgi:pimeloyl-ACP methyl ester carboxylesterase